MWLLLLLSFCSAAAFDACACGWKAATFCSAFVVPASADAMTYHTVVLWDTEMTHAIAAAPLQ